ncbi:SWIM zinc finger family protein [Nocardia alni]|uniref:SWIM zinc finger family protein n=1 Tax=Nocardia alni TaxID=2815723 RepID=UPI001C223FF4|nr:SWIM zinc finger family protein [Nocardia alni]
MTWTAQQVAAVAPDAASLAAANKLHGRWNGAGYHDTALWGLCAGSGATPYQTIVDVAGPAYKCSCPSRKFPCKHALGLLLEWARGEVPQAAAPTDFVAEWLGARAQRAAKSEAAPAKTPSAATAEQRRARVTAGLEDLDIWLCDQVRTGLAQADRSFAAFEAVAARMVDAQASGAASMLRLLPRNVVTREDWPALLLAEYARLHLLTAAHRRIDRLDPRLAATVRTHIGYSTATETVRGEAAVRDRWMVLGQRITEEERLFTRRMWLRGRATGRWALILDHSFGSPSFPADVPVPGMQVDADLHFHPAAAPLRAVWGERYGVLEPFTTLPVPRAGSTGLAPGDLADPQTSARAADSIGAALEDHARALGADPWLRTWPMLLVDVVPAVSESAWHVISPDGAALPVARLDAQPWKLLGISGGHPVTLVGEWTADGLVPVSALDAGEIVDVGANAVGANDAPATELASVALVGTARSRSDSVTLPEPVAAAAGRLRGDPAAVLLETAALLDIFTRGGVLAGAGAAGEPAEDDDRPLISPAAAARLARLLAERSPFLDEWFEVTGPRGMRAPDALCSLLLEQAKARTELREALLTLAGSRGRWLAAQHPQWRNLVHAKPDDQQVWSHGTPSERRAWLTALRRRDPRAAGAALARSWRSEPAHVRAELLAILADGLTLDDEPLLESALDDRRAEVRRTAADLLARLPESAFAERMVQRARGWVTVTDGRLVAGLSDRLDDAARRDGVADDTVHTAYRLDGAPYGSAGWLRRVIAATPLRHWEALFGGPGQAIRIGMPAELLGPVTAGWADAALAQGDTRWAATLFEVLTGTPTLGADPEVRRRLFELLPLEQRVRYLRTLDSSWLAEVELLLQAVPRPWPIPLAQHLIRLLMDRAQLAAARPGAPGLSPASYRTLFRSAAKHFPVEAAATVGVATRRCTDPYWESTFNELANDLTQRTTMLEELR